MRLRAQGTGLFKNRARLLALVPMAAVLTACFGATASPTASVASIPPATASATLAPSPSASQGTDPSAGGSSDPSDEPQVSGPFSCELPVHVDATVPRANLTATRIGQHDGYDRIVFEFMQGIPEVSIERAEPPFTADGSGLPIDVDGESFLRITMRGGTAQMDDGSSSYDGATAYDPEFDTLTALVQGGDFEAQSTWYVGMTHEACIRVDTLTDDGAPRLVIDLET